MLNVAFRVINDQGEACNVVQAAFMSGYKSFKNFRGEAQWLTRNTVNISKNRLKQLKARQSRAIFLFNEQFPANDSKLTTDPPSKGPSALDELEKHDMQNRVKELHSSARSQFSCGADSS